MTHELDSELFLPAGSRIFPVTEDTRHKVQLEVSNFSTYALPSTMALSQYIQRCFRTFHLHLPFLHEATWSPQDVAALLFLTLCANGALYNLEREIAFSLHKAAVAMMIPKVTRLCALQTTMLLIAFAAWSGDIKDLRLALQLEFHRDEYGKVNELPWKYDEYENPAIVKRKYT